MCVCEKVFIKQHHRFAVPKESHIHTDTMCLRSISPNLPTEIKTVISRERSGSGVSRCSRKINLTQCSRNVSFIKTPGCPHPPPPPVTEDSAFTQSIDQLPKHFYCTAHVCFLKCSVAHDSVCVSKVNLNSQTHIINTQEENLLYRKITILHVPTHTHDHCRGTNELCFSAEFDTLRMEGN